MPLKRKESDFLRLDVMQNILRKLALIGAPAVHVETGAFPSEEETYHMPAESAAILREMSRRAEFDTVTGDVMSDDLMADEAMER